MIVRRLALFGLATFATLAMGGAGTPVTASDGGAHRFAFPGLDGGEVRLSDFAGKPVLVVNTASECGFTEQYDDLQALWDQYRAEGLVVLGVPSDDFGGQELDTEAEVKHFCEVNFSINFPMTSITKVKGRDAHPFYRWAREALGARRAPGWNFHKYLVGPDGALLAAFPTAMSPTDSRIRRAIEPLLPGA